MVITTARFLFPILLAAGWLVVPSHAAPLTFAVIGDYGNGDPSSEGAVAHMITATDWDTDFILAAGDNNYGRTDVGAAGEWDDRVGRFYGSFIQGRSDNAYAYQTSPTQRFFPALGNHETSATGTGNDGGSGGINPGFVDYFQTDPGNPGGRLPPGIIEDDNVYYDFRKSDVHFFVIDSEHARVDPSSIAAQKTWLQDGLAHSTAAWKFVLLHHSPYSSSSIHGDHGYMQWSFDEWGADAVFGGHDHTFERSVRFGLPYFVSGLGGQTKYDFDAPGFYQEARYNEDFGAMRVTIDGDVASFSFLSIDDGSGGANGGQVVDTYTIDKSNPGPEHTVLVPRGSDWHYLDDGSDQEAAWREPSFPAANAWATGSAELGYGDGDESTVVHCGPGAPTCTADNFATTYFRQTFPVDPASLAGVTRLVLELVRDDGVAVYLNGTEVVRDQLGANAAFDDFATGTVSGDKAEPALVPFRVDPGLLVAGQNTLAVEVHQSSGTSSDLSFDLQLTTDFSTLPPPTITLLPTGSIWQYLDDGSDQGRAWKEVDFAAADGWAEGPAQLGYGDGDERSEVTFVDSDPVEPGTQKNATTYFRSTFEVLNASSIDTLIVELLRDDGAAVYLNGTRVVRSNLAEDAPFDEYATGTVSGGAESEFLSFSVDASLLLEGTNTLAVEVHQANATSSDISFDLRVLATRVVPEPSTWLLLVLGVCCGVAKPIRAARPRIVSSGPT